MSTYSQMLSATLPGALGPSLEALQFKQLRGMKWRRPGLEIRVVIDRKAQDPYTGGAFTLEFERSDENQFERKLSGRIRVYQLLDRSQRFGFLDIRNSIATSLPRPDAEYLSAIHPSLRSAYERDFFEFADLKEFEEWEVHPFMHFQNASHAQLWAEFLTSVAQSMVIRAESIDPRDLVVGLEFPWVTT